MNKYVPRKLMIPIEAVTNVSQNNWWYQLRNSKCFDDTNGDIQINILKGLIIPIKTFKNYREGKINKWTKTQCWESPALVTLLPSSAQAQAQLKAELVLFSKDPAPTHATLTPRWKFLQLISPSCKKNFKDELIRNWLVASLVCSACLADQPSLPWTWHSSAPACLILCHF